MHPSGQLPAYEWDFSDANPPVHAHAARRVYEITRDLTGEADTEFLEEVFHKLLLNFTWWVNRKDPEGRNAFQGGFLGLDNIGVFDRSRPNLGEGRRLEQADGTAWMGMFCLDMLAIALELSHTRPAYEGIATKFFEHFVAISHAINGFDDEIGMWDPRRRFLLRRGPGQGRAAAAPQGPLVRGLDPPFRLPGDRTGHARTSAPLSPAGGVVHPLSLHRWPATSA